MEEMKKFEELVATLNQELTDIGAPPKVKEVLDLINQEHKLILTQAINNVKKAEEESHRYFHKYMEYDNKLKDALKELDLQHKIVTTLLCDKYQINPKEEDILPF